MAVQLDSLTDDILGGSKLVLPEAIADHRNEARSVQTALLVCERSADHRPQAERLEVVRGHETAMHRVAAVLEREGESFELKREQRTHRPAFSCDLQVIWIAVSRMDRLRVDDPPQRHEPIGLDAGCRLREEPVDDRKNRGV